MIAVAVLCPSFHVKLQAVCSRTRSFQRALKQVFCCVLACREVCVHARVDTHAQNAYIYVHTFAFLSAQKNVLRCTSVHTDCVVTHSLQTVHSHPQQIYSLLCSLFIVFQSLISLELFFGQFPEWKS